MGPGPNPFGFDLSQLMRMLQSPGPVNMEVARNTAEATSMINLETGQPESETPLSDTERTAFDDVVRAAQLAVAEATGLSGALSTTARGVTRREWAATTLQGLEPVLGALAEALGRGQHDEQADAPASPDALLGMMMQGLVPLLLGVWSGSMIGSLAHHALAQYDLPLPLGDEPAMAFVVRNVGAFADEWSLPLDELRYALALREVTHAAERSVPWVRARLVHLASEYVGAYEVQADALEGHFRDLDPSDPQAMASLQELADPDALLGAMRSERQGPLLAELQRFVAVLEGYTDVVVASLGERMVAAHTRIDEALRRQRLERGDAAAFVDRLLGLELDREHYEMGVAFCRGVIERSDGSFDGLNRLWSAEHMTPTASEIAAPGLWLARIDLP
jgi:putative hydrolase